MKTIKVVIDSTSRISYSSYYIKGLYDVFGYKNVSFGKKHFQNLKREKKLFSFEHFFAFVTIENDNITRYVVDFCDPPDICQIAYNWCDVYAKINFNRTAIDFDDDKIIIIPPSFGIKIWNKRATIFHGLKNFFTSPLSLPTDPKNFLRDYYQQYKRRPLKDYMGDFKNHATKQKPYIFMIGTLWAETDNAKATNKARKKFIEVCKSLPNCKFEGGLYANINHSEYNDSKDLIFTKPYSMDEFISKTQKSDIVFNTPAVHQCHGWKLAEYHAMGKAIISTKLSNELPHDLVHGVNIHVIDDLNQIESSVNTLLNNHTYRHLLSKNAKKYFLEYMTPSSVINQILEKNKKMLT